MCVVYLPYNRFCIYFKKVTCKTNEYSQKRYTFKNISVSNYIPDDDIDEIIINVKWMINWKKLVINILH